MTLLIAVTITVSSVMMMASQQQAFATSNVFGTPVILDSEGLVGIGSSITVGTDGFPVVSYSDITNHDMKLVHCTSIDCTSNDTPVTLDRVGTSSSITVGTDGFPVVSYHDATNLDLKVVHCTSIDCTSNDTPVTLDSAGRVGTSSSITVGTDGFPVVSYHDITNSDLKVVHCTSIDCTSNDTPIVLDSADRVGSGSSITVGTDGFPVVSYRDFTNRDLKVVHCTSIDCTSNDTPIVLDSEGVVGTESSITVGTDGFPVVSYHDDTNLDLKVVHCTSIDCTSNDTPVTLDSAGDVGRDSSITVGTDGFPVVSYRDFTNNDNDLKLVHCTSIDCTSNDTPVTLDSEGLVGHDSSITVGTDGFPVVSYYDATNGDLKVIQCTGINCTSSDTPAPVITLNGDDSITLEVGIDTYTEAGATVTDDDPDYSGTITIGGDVVDVNTIGIYIVTYDASADATGNVPLQVIRTVTVQNTTVILESEGDVGHDTSIAIGSDGFPVVSYYDETNDDLKLVHCTSIDCTSNDTPVTLDSAGVVGRDSSITVGTDGFPVVSYYDETNDDLKLVHCTSIDCTSNDTPVTLDSANRVGFDSSITVGTDGFPVVIYYTDYTNHNLKLVHCTSIDCTSNDTPIVLDSEGLVGISSSITVGTDGFPVVSYHDEGIEDLKVVHCTSIDCTSNDTPVTLDSAGVVGRDTSIAIGSDGFPVVSYRDFNNNDEDLKLVHCTSIDCTSNDTPVTLDSANRVGFDTSIAIGSDGFPVVSYYDFTNRDLKLVHCTSIDCTSNDTPIVLDSADRVGRDTSIAIGSDGFPVVSYLDDTNRDLKVVHCTSIDCTSNDTPAPVITLNGDDSITLEVGIDTYTEAGATVTDDDPDYSESVIIGGDTVDADTIGTYIVTYDAPADAAGNVPLQVTRTITVQDTTAPTITVPSDFEVEATNPIGTPVTFDVTASDIADTNPTIECSLASGDDFSLGATIVTCTATDESGNSNSDSFTVTLVVSTTTFDGIVNKIQSMGLHHGIENSLVSKINSASSAFEDGNNNAAINKLGAFINHVNAQDGKKITAQQADLLRDCAQVLIDNL